MPKRTSNSAAKAHANSLCAVLLWWLAVAAGFEAAAQPILLPGRNAKDKFLAEFWERNNNASNLIAGLNANGGTNRFSTNRIEWGGVIGLLGISSNVFTADGSAADRRAVLGLDAGAPGATGTNLLTAATAADALSVLGLSEGGSGSTFPVSSNVFTTDGSSGDRRVALGLDAGTPGAIGTNLLTAETVSTAAGILSIPTNIYNLGNNIGIGTNAPTAQLVVLSQPGEPAIVLENDSNSGGSLNTLGGTRGFGAVDLQYGRNTSTKIASGKNSFIGGGTNNTASALYSAVVGGTGNTASGIASAIVGGLGNTAGGNYSVSLGYASAATEQYAFASGLYSSANLLGSFSRSSGRFSSSGDAQMSIITARAILTLASTSSTNLWLDGLSTMIVMPANTSWAFRAEVVGRTTNAGTGDEESGAYTITGLIERDNAAANTRIVGKTIVEIAEDDAAWGVDATANTTSGALTITVTGNNETTIRWVATVYLTQVGG